MDDIALHERASEALLEHKDALASAITDRLYDRDPDLLDRYGAEGRLKCLQDMHFNLEHLAPAVALGEPAMFVRYVEWLRDLLAARGVPADDVRRSLEVTIEVVEEAIGAESSEPVARIVQEAIAALPGSSNP